MPIEYWWIKEVGVPLAIALIAIVGPVTGAILTYIYKRNKDWKEEIYKEKRKNEELLDRLIKKMKIALLDIRQFSGMFSDYNMLLHDPIYIDELRNKYNDSLTEYETTKHKFKKEHQKIFDKIINNVTVILRWIDLLIYDDNEKQEIIEDLKIKYDDDWEKYVTPYTQKKIGTINEQFHKIVHGDKVDDEDCILGKTKKINKLFEELENSYDDV